MSAFHPDLATARFIPNVSIGPRVAALVNKRMPRSPDAPDDMIIENVDVPARVGEPAVSLRIYRPRTLTGLAPALFWIHGGGFVIGQPEQDEKSSIAFARTLGITVVAARNRLAPQHPAPAALDDVYAGLAWVFAHADSRGIDPERIAVGGASAGGGLAAGLVLMAHDRAKFAPAFQLLVYPMLDDRTVDRTEVDGNVRIWSSKSNRFGWSAYLGDRFGSNHVSPYSAPARREDLSGLPPTWLGVGTLDLFADEDLEYARRLNDSGVPCEVELIDGVFHGFDILFRKSNVAKEFWRSQARALHAALFPADDVLTL